MVEKQQDLIKQQRADIDEMRKKLEANARITHDFQVRVLFLSLK